MNEKQWHHNTTNKKQKKYKIQDMGIKCHNKTIITLYANFKN